MTYLTIETTEAIALTQAEATDLAANERRIFRARPQWDARDAAAIGRSIRTNGQDGRRLAALYSSVGGGS